MATVKAARHLTVASTTQAFLPWRESPGNVFLFKTLSLPVTARGVVVLKFDAENNFLVYKKILQFLKFNYFLKFSVIFL